jgi:hypothetical protein
MMVKDRHEISVGKLETKDHVGYLAQMENNAKINLK